MALLCYAFNKVGIMSFDYHYGLALRLCEETFIRAEKLLAVKHTITKKLFVETVLDIKQTVLFMTNVYKEIENEEAFEELSKLIKRLDPKDRYRLPEAKENEKTDSGLKA